MSDISLRDFNRAAFDAGSGVIRTEKGSDDKQLNKGTLGQRIASWVRDVKDFFAGRPDASRVERQQSALDGFKSALENRFGEFAAGNALHEVGLDLKDAVLTGDAVKRAIWRANEMEVDTRQQNTTAMKGFYPPRAGFFALCDKAQPPFDPRTMTDRQAEEYTTRFQESCKAESRGGKLPISPERMERIAQKTLNQVVRLSETGNLDAREKLTASVKDLLLGLAERPKDPSTVLALLNAVDERLGEVIRSERTEGDEVGAQELADRLAAALDQAVSELEETNPGTARLAQHMAFSANSYLGAIYIEALEQTQNSQLPDGKRLAVQRPADNAARLVELLAQRLSPMTDSVRDDQLEFDRRANVNPNRAQAGLAVRSWLDTLGEEGNKMKVG